MQHDILSYALFDYLLKCFKQDCRTNLLKTIPGSIPKKWNEIFLLKVVPEGRGQLNI